MELEEKLGYVFRDKSLLASALSHSSYANERKAIGYNSNERLEFLGDAVLGFVTADVLYRVDPALLEGRMTGGSAARGTGMLSRANELSRLREQRGTLDNEMENCRRELDEAKRELAKVGYQLTAATDELNLLHSDTAAQESEKRATQGAADQLRALLDALSGDGASRRAVIAAEEAKAERLKTELRGREKQLEEINARAAGIRAEIARLNEARLELEGKRTKNDRDAQDRNKELLNMVGCLDTVKGTVNVVSIPRDTLVDTAYRVKKINNIYPVSINNGGNGIDDLMAAVKDLVGFSIDSYAVIDLEACAKIVDIIGGVTFDVPVKMYYDDPAQDLHIAIPAGTQTLSGDNFVKVMADLRKREYYQSPSVKRRKKSEAARKNKNKRFY